MKDIKELALKVAKEMNWRMDEMTLETFATRFLAAYTAEQKPVAWVPQFSWQRSIDAVACISKRSFDDIPLYAAPLAQERELELEQQNAELVAALELCKQHMIGDKWDSLFIDGVLSKVKQP